MQLSEKNLLEALKTVMDPDLHKDLVSLGMIEDIRIDGQQVSFKVMLTTPACPLKNKIKQDCLDAIRTHFGPEVKAEVEMSARVTSRQSGPGLKESLPGVKNIIAVVSGKGGVGKSTVAANLAVALAKTGAKTGLVDADIYGPSVPLMFGLENERPEVIEKDGHTRMLPLQKFGLKLNSIGFLVEPEKALIWRGPMASSALKQLLSDTEWGELDYLVVDTPPGTGDIHLTLAQNFHLSGLTIVTTPQKVALADVRKAIHMYRQDGLKVPVLGLIENMSYFTPAELPDHKYYIFGKEGGARLAKELDLPLLGQIPLVQSVCESGDAGRPVVAAEDNPVSLAFDKLAQTVSQQVAIWNAFTEMTTVKPCK